MDEIDEERLLGYGAEDVGQLAEAIARVRQDPEEDETDARPQEELTWQPVPLLHARTRHRPDAHVGRDGYEHGARHEHPPVGEGAQVRRTPSGVHLPDTGPEQHEGGPREERELRAGRMDYG